MISNAEAVGDSYENIGVMAKTGLVDRKLLLDIHSLVILDAWNALIDVTAILRAHYGSVLWENFEYLVVLAQDYDATHRGGDYPPGRAPRLTFHTNGEKRMNDTPAALRLKENDSAQLP